MKFILICATERSGSTTLQRIINSIPNSNITGEKYGSIENLLECYKNIKDTCNNVYKKKNLKFSDNNLKENKEEFLTFDELKEQNIKPCWYNSFDFIEVQDNIKNTIMSILTNNDKKNEFKVLGYKEIRWFDKLYLLNEFIELFPNTKIICHLSDDIERQLKSGWLNESSRCRITNYNDQLINYSSNNKNCYLSYMKNLFDINEIKKIFLYLEEPFDEKEYNFIINNNLF
jgi:hypothetical protein